VKLGLRGTISRGILAKRSIGEFHPALQPRLNHVTFAARRDFPGISENSKHVLPQVVAAAALERKLRVRAHDKLIRSDYFKSIRIVRYSTLCISADINISLGLGVRIET